MSNCMKQCKGLCVGEHRGQGVLASIIEAGPALTGQDSELDLGKLSQGKGMPPQVSVA